MLKIFTDVNPEELEKKVNAFVDEHPIYSSTYSVTDGVFVAFVDYVDMSTKTSATKYYENSDNMTMEEILHDAC